MVAYKTRSAVKAIGADGLTLADRLRRLWRERGGETYGDFAKRCGAPENTVKAWLNGDSLPGTAHLRGISTGFEVSIDFLVNGEPTPGPSAGSTVHDAARAAAPLSIPEAVREDYGWLVQKMGYGGNRTHEEAQRAALQLVTAMLTELRRQSGERKKAPQSLLEDLRDYKGAQGLTRYLFWSLLAAEQIVRFQRPPRIRINPATRRR
jgi:transcriptional regulator with XRE-family HTH domain